MTAKTRSDMLEITAVVKETLPNSMYRAEIMNGPEQLVGKVVLCTLNGNMRRFNIRVLPGDMVTAEMSVYDLNRARIVYRLSGSYEEDLARWRTLKGRVSQAIVANGGTISHQHGVGTDHAPYLEAEKGALGLGAMRALFEYFDPERRMNPGKLVAR